VPWDPGQIPDRVLALADPAEPVRLPPPSRAFCTLPNKEIDKLIHAISTDAAIWPRVIQLTDWLALCGFRFDSRTCTTLIISLAQHSQFTRSLQIYNWMRADLGLQPTVYTYTAVMKAALAAGDIETALNVWRDAKRTRTTRDDKLTCTYMSVLLRAGRLRQVLQLHGEMCAAQGGVPQQAAALAMRAETRLGRPEAALSIWSKMLDSPYTSISGAGPAVMPCIADRHRQSVEWGGSFWGHGSLFEGLKFLQGSRSRRPSEHARCSGIAARQRRCSSR
jgi:pentatricopeptide repeat protein